MIINKDSLEEVKYYIDSKWVKGFYLLTFFFGGVLMKKIIMIGGTMGVGKTTVSQSLKGILNKSVFLDGDWCWNMHPFVVNEETKSMVMNNIVYQLNQFIHCSFIENIIFCWVMHEQSIIDDILSRLDLVDCQVYCFSLICKPSVLKMCIQKDVDLGKRNQDVLERSLERLGMYDRLNTIKLDVSELAVEDAVKMISHLIQEV